MQKLTRQEKISFRRRLSSKVWFSVQNVLLVQTLKLFLYLPGPTFSSARSSHASAGSAGITKTDGERCQLWQSRCALMRLTRDICIGLMMVPCMQGILSLPAHDHVLPAVEGVVSRVGPDEQSKGMVLRGNHPMYRMGLARPTSSHLKGMPPT